MALPGRREEVRWIYLPNTTQSRGEATCPRLHGESRRCRRQLLRDLQCVVFLLAEVERLRALLEPIQAERDELRSEITTLEWQLSEATKAAERLRAFVQKVALYSNDAWLAREADELAPGASL